MRTNKRNSSLVAEKRTDPEQIQLLIDKPYYVVPSGEKVGEEAFAVIRDAMRDKDRVALGRIVMAHRPLLQRTKIDGLATFASHQQRAVTTRNIGAPVKLRLFGCGLGPRRTDVRSRPPSRGH